VPEWRYMYRPCIFIPIYNHGRFSNRPYIPYHYEQFPNGETCLAIRPYNCGYTNILQPHCLSLNTAVKPTAGEIYFTLTALNLRIFSRFFSFTVLASTVSVEKSQKNPNLQHIKRNACIALVTT